MARKIFVNKRDLNLKMMLEGGQCFRWKQTDTAEWAGVMLDLLWVIKQFDDHIEYDVHGDTSMLLKNDNELSEKTILSPNTEDHFSHLDSVLKNYLRLHDDVTKYYEEWSERDHHFRKIASEFSGIRILNQDPIENVFSFICSSNNNIKRITCMITKLCELYGKKITEFKGTTYFSFPTVPTLAEPSVEMELRNAGLGYRAKYIHQSAKKLHDLGELSFLDKLKSDSYESAKEQLMKFPGIGAKVADCICLMSLGHLQAVPVDIHVFKIASENYLPHLRNSKTVTNRIYEEIGNHFRTLYGPLAGWAQAVLFCADLKTVGNGSNERSKATVNRSIKTEIPSTNGEPEIIYKDNKEIETGSINCSREELHLRITLNSGQTYRWTELEPDVWRGVCYSRVWTLKQSDNKIDFTSVRSIKDEPPNKKGTLQNGRAKQLLHEYFRLDFPLKEYYERWAKADQHFNEISVNFYGLRMIRQDIVENLFAFICSSNNTINRIRNMVESMCKLYGDEITTIDGAVYHDFPPVTRLQAENVEDDLRLVNFGFRAPYIRDSARYIVKNGGQQWFNNLCQLSYEEARNELMNLPGVGAKIADCICLTALDHLNTIPVDTHVYQIASKHYLPHLRTDKEKKTQNVPATIYQEIGDCFRNIFGDYAGWAHTVLFCADLRQHLDLKSSEKNTC